MFKKRCFQIYLDNKSLFLEILCPILLILIVSHVKFNFSSSPQVASVEILGLDIIFYGIKDNTGVIFYKNHLIEHSKKL